jgi:hypothetical protein
MLDGVECTGRREAWAVCRLQEQLNLSDAERDAIGWHKIVQDGREYVLWQQNGASHEVMAFELNDDDVQRLCRALDQFRMVPARDRNWYEPLVRQLPEPPLPALGPPPALAAANGVGMR